MRHVRPARLLSLLLLSAAGCASAASDHAPTSDAGLDAGTDAALAPPDASTGDDASVPSPDAGVDDAGFPEDAGVVVRALGSVTLNAYAATCPASFGSPVGQTVNGAPNPQFHCALVTVSCPGVDDLQAAVALAAPADGSSKGVIETHAGSAGMTFQNDKNSPAWFAAGWSIAAISWAGPWECPKPNGASCAKDSTPAATRPALKDAACRPATLMKWIHDAAVRPDGEPFLAVDQPFCGFGASGGSGAHWFALLHYGLADSFDFVQLAASTPFGRIDIACDPNHLTTKVAPACENVPNAPLVPETFGSNRAIDSWFSTNSCNASPTEADLGLWARNSVVSEGADFDIATPVTTYDCVDLPTINLVPGMGAYVFAALHARDPASARFRSLCVVSGVNGTCSGEGVLQDATMRQAAIDEMEQRCRPMSR